MSGRISTNFIDFIALFVEFDDVRCASCGLFLVRNWCGAIETWSKPVALQKADLRTTKGDVGFRPTHVSKIGGICRASDARPLNRGANQD